MKLLFKQKKQKQKNHNILLDKCNKVKLNILE